MWVDAIMAASKGVDKKSYRKMEKLRRRRGPPILIKALSELPRDAQALVRKSDISQTILEENFDVTLNILRFRTGYQLRNARDKKIEKDPAQPRFIKTVWGIGYRFAEPEELENEEEN